MGDEEALAAFNQPVEELANRIEASAKEASAGGELQSLEIDDALLRALTEYEEHRLRENIQRGRHIMLVGSTFEIMSFDEGLSELSDAIRAIGEVHSTLPAPGETPESQIRFSLLVASDLNIAELTEALDFPDADVQSVREGAPVKEKVSKEEADALKAKLEEAGATVQIK